MTDTAMSTLLLRPATELADLVRRGEVTSRELVDASLARIEQLNDRLGAFIYVDADAARETADSVSAGDERPFAGVPIAIKDIGPPWAGRPYTCGAELFGDFVPPIDGYVVRRIKDAGFVPVGKTKTPEFGILPVTEPRRYGPARNPWDSDRTPGGSSGGSAAALCAGLVPIAHASDGGGSIRIPAACCGLVGLKPSRGRMSAGPLLGDSPLVIDGGLTRTVADTAALLDVLAGYEAGDATWAPPPARPFAHAAERDPGRLRIGYSLLSPVERVSPDEESTRGVTETAELLRSLGHDVEEADPPWQNPDTLELFTVLWAVQVGMTVRFAGQISGREPAPELMERLSWELYERGRETSAYEHAAAVIQLQAFVRGVIAWMSQYDAFLCPTLAQRPVPIGEIDGEAGMEAFARSADFTPYTAPINLSGQPAISLPVLQGGDGLPTAVQIVGRPAGDWELLQLAAQIERELPWAGRRPDLG